MEQIADDIESELYQSMTREIESTAIGEKVMEKLKNLMKLLMYVLRLYTKVLMI